MSIEYLEQLPAPVYFVCKDVQKWGYLMNDRPLPSNIGSIYDELLSGEDAYIIQTYVQLKLRGLNVHLVSKFIPNQICLAHYDCLAIKDYPFNSYVVCCRVDRPKPKICEATIVQNPLLICDEKTYYIIHWTLLNIIPRKRDRGDKITNIIYRGGSGNLAKIFKSQEFLHQLQLMNINMSISIPINSKKIKVNWNDYSEGDLVLAVRNLTEYDLTLKTDHKLTNAWTAGVPALLGPEPAYQRLRKSELDYIEVRSPEDVISAIQRLRDNPKLYRAMIENGLERAKAFAPDKIAQDWRNLLAGPIYEDYQRWLNQSYLWKSLGRPIQFAIRSIQHKREKKYYFIHINQGKRLFEEK